MADYTLGIDIGGTNTVFGVVNSDGDIVVRGKISTTGHNSFPDYLTHLKDSVKKEAEIKGIDFSEIKAIGVGAPCLNPETGVIEGAVDLPWRSPIPLTYELRSIFGVPAAGENDANAAALGEMYYGSAKGLNNFIMITLGTGVGSAIICDGRLLHGKRGLAGELGHTIIRRDENARMCNCGRRGCLETYVSARGLIETAKELLATSDEPSSLRNVHELNSKIIGEAAVNGDSISLQALNKTGEILGEACADFTAFSSPEAFIFFGGVAGSFTEFKDAMIESYRKNLLWVYDGNVKFMKSSLNQDDAAILGAAAVGKSLIS